MLPLAIPGEFLDEEVRELRWVDGRQGVAG